MSAKHTPGPWRVVVGVSAPFVDATKRTIRPHYVINQEPPHDAPQVVTEAEAHANARLIAAAPTMADLLRDAVRILPRDDETVAGFLDDARDLLADLGIAAGNAHRDREPECTCSGGPQGEGLVSIPHEPHCPRRGML